MVNEEYWDALFKDLDNMTKEEFSSLLDELDAMEDIPFAISETEY